MLKLKEGLMMTENSDPITVEFLRYNRWANLSLLDSCRDLTPDQLNYTGPGAYGTIYATLVHIIRAEAGYYRLLTGTRLTPPFSWDDNPSVADIRPYAEQVSSALVETAGGIQPADLVREEASDGQVYIYKSSTLLIQIVNHGVEHRTNITTLLVQLGIVPPEIDGWAYMEANMDRMGP
jgi:uncharacterized damage-inducible protein DinB